MSAQPTSRGGAPVGQLAHMEGLEAASVLYLRLWCDGARSRQAVRDDFAVALGPDHGAADAEGAREDALLMATLIVRADMAPMLTSLARECGLALKCMALATPRDMARRTATAKTLH